MMTETDIPNFVKQILDSLINVTEVDLDLPNDLDEAIKKARKIVIDIAGQMPAKGFDIAFIREKTPKEEIENVVSLIERMNKEFQFEVNNFLDYLENLELLNNTTIIGAPTYRVEIQTKLAELVIKANKMINEIKRLIITFILYNYFKLAESILLPPAGGNVK